MTARRISGFLAGAFLLPVLLFLAHLALPASARATLDAVAAGLYVPARALATALSPHAGTLDGTRLVTCLGAQTLLMGVLASAAFELARAKWLQRQRA